MSSSSDGGSAGTGDRRRGPCTGGERGGRGQGLVFLLRPATLGRQDREGATDDERDEDEHETHDRRRVRPIRPSVRGGRRR